jgi:hypothetical protein
MAAVTMSEGGDHCGSMAREKEGAASMAQRRGRRKRWRSAGAVRRKKVGWAAWAERPDGPAGHWADWAESEGKILF